MSVLRVWGIEHDIPQSVIVEKVLYLAPNGTYFGKSSGTILFSITESFVMVSKESELKYLKKPISKYELLAGQQFSVPEDHHFTISNLDGEESILLICKIKDDL